MGIICVSARILARIFLVLKIRTLGCFSSQNFNFWSQVSIKKFEFKVAASGKETMPRLNVLD